MQSMQAFPINTYCQMAFPVRLETYRAIKSVPAVEAFPFRAVTMAMP